MIELVEQVDAAELNQNRLAVVDADVEGEKRFLLSRKVTDAALFSDRREVEAAGDEAPTDRNAAAVKAVA